MQTAHGSYGVFMPVNASNHQRSYLEFAVTRLVLPVAFAAILVHATAASAQLVPLQGQASTDATATPKQEGPNKAADPTPTPDKSHYTLFDPTPDAQMRAFSTDRPNKSNSPYTVDAGHFQYETDLLGAASDGYSIGHGEYRQLFTADPVLKLGLTNDTDLEIGLGGFEDLRTKQRGTGPASVYSGYGDTTVRLKVNVFGNDGGTTAFALIPYVKVPTSDRGLGNNQVEGGVIAPLQVTLPYNFTAIFMTQFDVYKNPNDSGKHAGFENLVNLSHPITDKLTASAEFFSQVQAANVPAIYTADFSLAYMLGPNTQLDGAVYAGLNKAAPDVVGYIGLSQRF